MIKSNNTKTTAPPIKTSIEEIDNVIYNFISKKINPKIYDDNNNLINVPVIYQDREKWVSTQKDGYQRDKDGKILYPLITYTRNSIKKDRSLTIKIDGNNSNFYIYVNQEFNKDNKNDNFYALNKKTQPKIDKFKLVIIPDYLNLSYSLNIITNRNDDNAKLIEDIEFCSDSYWGEAPKYNFFTSATDFSTTTTNENERIVTTTCNLSLNGYIIPNSYISYLAKKGVEEEYTKPKIKVDFKIGK